MDLAVNTVKLPYCQTAGVVGVRAAVDRCLWYRNKRVHYSTVAEMKMKEVQCIPGMFAVLQHEEDAVDSEGWFSTGDIATLDPYGYMHITDRLKDVIKSGGEWISSIEVENIAASHPKVILRSH